MSNKSEWGNEIWIVGAIILVALMLTSGGNVTNIFNQNPNAPLDPEIINSHYTLALDISPNRICVGDTAVGSIQSDISSGVCSIYYNPGTGFRLYKNVWLNANGDYSETSPPMTAVGVATFRAVCCDSDLNCKISNDETLAVEACDDGSGDGGDGGFICTDTDGGMDIYNAGTCTGSGGSVTDDCASQTYVNENWCQGEICWGASMLCPTGYHCWEGECILTQQACTSIWNPSPTACAQGACQTGTCVYVPATVYSIARCACE